MLIRVVLMRRGQEEDASGIAAILEYLHMWGDIVAMQDLTSS